MDTHTLKVLEFDKIRRFLKTCAASPGGKRLCENLVPATQKDTVQQLLDETSQMRAEIQEHGLLQLTDVHDIQHAVSRSRIDNFYLEPEDLLRISDTLETADTLRNYFAGLEEECPLLFRMSRGITDLQSMVKSIRTCISPRADILDTASPRLTDIRQQVKKHRQTIIRTLEELVGTEDISYAFQDDYITLRNNRYVIPVRSDSKSVVPGVVHDQSQTRATFFVEPLSVVSLNNELQLLRKEEYYEEIRILTALTGSVCEHSSAILSNLDIIEHIDLIHARAVFAKALEGRAPNISSDGSIELHRCRHPILLSRCTGGPSSGNSEEAVECTEERWNFDRTDVVPVDLIKGPSTSTLIITGANAGGKTVALKTLGLFVLMTQAGMHIPAAGGSCISVFESVFADIGDEQNIETNLSTFSARMVQLRRVLEYASNTSLVLLDELGSGTDPAEGGALAAAVLDHLRSRGCCTAITTHLNLLKTYAYRYPDVENVSVAFDPATLQPTYRLSYGIPGISNALAIAANSGIPAPVLESARSYMGSADHQIDDLMQGLEDSRNALLEQTRAAATLHERLLSLVAAAERLANAMKQKKADLLRSFEKQSRSLLRTSEDELNTIIKTQRKKRLIRPDQDNQASAGARKRFDAVKTRLFERFPEKKVSTKQVENLKPGQHVSLISVGKEGVVVNADDETKKAEVAVGSLRIKTEYSELAPFPGDRSRQKPNHRSAPPAPAHGTAPSEGREEINVIGMRVQEALPVIDKSIDTAILRNAATLDVIHGRGTGRLMRAIHEHLKEHRYVAGFTQGGSDSGGTGVTIVRIK